MRPENQKMVEFLKANGIVATVKYCRSGSMRGCWYLWSKTLKYDDAMREKLTALGFRDFDNRPLSQYSGNGGMFSLQVRGHGEFVAEAWSEQAERLNASLTDCGRKQSGYKERADCTVRATAAALGIAYPEAHAKLKALGRKNRCAFHIFAPECRKALGLKLKHAGGVPVGAIVPELQVGRYIVEVRHHVFAVVDGKVLDYSVPNERCNVRSVYQVANPQQAVTA